MATKVAFLGSHLMETGGYELVKVHKMWGGEGEGVLIIRRRGEIFVPLL